MLYDETGGTNGSLTDGGQTIGLTERQLISSLLGHLSVACSVIIIAPQIWMTFRKKSGEGVSLVSWFIWLIGDVLGIAAVVLEGLLNTQIFLYVWLAAADVILISQILWYRYLNARRRKRSSTSSVTPINTTSSPPQRHPHPPRSRSEIVRDRKRSILGHAGFIVFVLGIAILVWGVSVYRVRDTQAQDKGKNGVDVKGIEVKGFVLGWITAAMFAGARLPQIWRNWKRKSCDGLSIWLYVLILLTNWFFLASILVASTRREYLLANLPFIIGHSATAVLDCTIFSQFIIYRDKAPSDSDSDPDPESASDVEKSMRGSGGEKPSSELPFHRVDLPFESRHLPPSPEHSRNLSSSSTQSTRYLTDADLLACLATNFVVAKSRGGSHDGSLSWDSSVSGSWKERAREPSGEDASPPGAKPREQGSSAVMGAGQGGGRTGVDVEVLDFRSLVLQDLGDISLSSTLGLGIEEEETAENIKRMVRHSTPNDFGSSFMRDRAAEGWANERQAARSSSSGYHQRFSNPGEPQRTLSDHGDHGDVIHSIHHLEYPRARHWHSKSESTSSSSSASFSFAFGEAGRGKRSRGVTFADSSIDESTEPSSVEGYPLSMSPVQARHWTNPDPKIDRRTLDFDNIVVTDEQGPSVRYIDRVPG